MPLQEVDWADGKHDLREFLTRWAESVAAKLTAAASPDTRVEMLTRSRLATTAAAEQSPSSPPHATVAARFADSFGAQMVDAATGRPLAAVHFVGADHKADSDGALVFAIRVAALASSGARVVVVDIAPGPASWATHLNTLAPVFPITRRPRGPGASVFLCTPRAHGGAEHYDTWYHTVAAGGAFPTVLLPVRGETFLKLDLEGTYTEACANSHIP